MSDHDRNNADYQRGLSEGYLRLFVTVALTSLVCLTVFKHCGDSDRIEWLRKHVVKTGGYEPCKNPGADWAMDVDCSTWRKLQK